MKSKIAVVASLLAALALPSGAARAIEPRPFAPGSLIIPMDNCYQGDIAQPTTSAEEKSGGTGNCVDQPGSNGYYANGARRAYGLVWHLLQAGVPLYWIIDPEKGTGGASAPPIDGPDLTINVAGCGATVDAVRIVDQSVPASACGLDALNAKDMPANLYTSSPPADCTKAQAPGNTGAAIGTYPLGAKPQPSISYRGGPFVVDATNAALARDVMAWYYAQPTPSPGGIPYSSPASGPAHPGGAFGSWVGPNGTSYLDPGHHPLHWSAYTPSALVPLYPAANFNQPGRDIGGHQPFAPCNDGWCGFTTWDPISPNGRVDPWGNAGNAAQNEITYATVNVHQAQYPFSGKVGQLITSPIPPIALAALSDPLHLNTFRFYLEEAGLTFGPCAASAFSTWFPGGVGFPGSTLGTGDLFFDPTAYPFPSNLTPPTAPYSNVPASCSEGISSDDPTFLSFDPSGSVGPSLGGGPYGKVLDLIAPEVAAFRSLLQSTNPTTPAAIGCGAPRYSQLWIPHWDATIQSGPTTIGDPLAAAMNTTLNPHCPTAGYNAASFPPADSVTGQCPWDPLLVQTVLDDLRVYVAHGGNLLAECLGAASLEDNLYGGLIGQFTLNETSGPVQMSQLPTHFMTEWQVPPVGVASGITAFAPALFYDLEGAPSPTQSAVIPIGYAGVNSCMDNPTGPLSGVPGYSYLAYQPPSRPATSIPPIGWPGRSLTTYPQTGGPPTDPSAALAWQVNYNSAVNPGADPYHVIEYAPLLQNGAAQSQTSLGDPFLQVGDFYFLGIFGATESFSEGVNEGTDPVTGRRQNFPGYAFSASSGIADTQVLIRGLASKTGVDVDPTFETGTLNNTTTSVIGDYWIRNRNQQAGAGTVVYLQGDSFDGRPDGLRMVWSSILNLSFVPSDRELARSSPAGYVANNQTNLLQGTFQQANIDYGRYSPVYNNINDSAAWIFPPERGHLRGYNLTADNCFVDGGVNVTKPGCQSAVAGAGNNSSNFRQQTNVPNPSNPLQPIVWDTSENVFQTPANSLLFNDVPTNEAVNRTLFTHLYNTTPGQIGLIPVSLNPTDSTAIGHLTPALFPVVSSALACPQGDYGACISGTSVCDAQCGTANLPKAVTSDVTSASVTNMLEIVSRANGGCTPLLQDSCYPDNSTQVQCLDQCWAGCLSTCIPPAPAAGSPALPTNFPPYTSNPGCQTCGFNCAQSCNNDPVSGKAAACGATSCCGVSNVPDTASFRETCFPAIGGIDHSTPVVVGPPSAALNEVLPDSSGATSYSAACRPTVAYVGAADGMLHAIYLADPNPPAGVACPAVNHCAYQPGQEIWAFMPNQNLPILHTGGDCTRSLFVDGVPVVKDVFADFSTNPNLPPSWHTVLTETLGQGGNHAFALDVTDPLVPIRGSNPSAACIYPVTNMNAAQSVVLWEQGDPLDISEPHPYFDKTSGLYSLSAPYASARFFDSATEGPGFVASPPPIVNPGPSVGGSFHHYLGQSSTTFVGNLVGSGASLSVTYVAGQNGGNTNTDGYGRAITLGNPSTAFPTCPSCNPKDFSGLAKPTAFGPQGEVVYGFDTASGVPRTYEVITGGTAQDVVQHFALLYDTTIVNYRSAGHNDIPAPVLGVSTTGQPETDLLVVPDLDGQLWGLQPATLASGENYHGNAFPLFDIHRYHGVPFGASETGPRFQAVPPGNSAIYTALEPQAAFGNPAALLPAGSCPGVGNGSNDPVVLIATGGVDWGPAASIIAAVDVAVDDFQLGAGPIAIKNDSSAELIPVINGANRYDLEVPTCNSSSGPCLGRVFGQPLIVGSGVYFSTNTGLLTGVGSTLDQQNGDGTISTLGDSSCSASNTNTCSVCASQEQSVVLQSRVGKVASGLTGLAASGNSVEVFGASTTGLSNVVATAKTKQSSTNQQRLSLEQFWLRPQRPGCLGGAKCSAY